MKIDKIRKLTQANKFEEALTQIDRLIEQDAENPYLWNLRGDLIQLLPTMDGPPLSEAGKSYRKALKLNPNDLETLGGLAHFYDAVEQKPLEAKKYAKEYIK